MNCDGYGCAVEHGELVRCEGCDACHDAPGINTAIAYDTRIGHLTRGGLWVTTQGRVIRRATHEEAVEYGIDTARAMRRAA